VPTQFLEAGKPNLATKNTCNQKVINGFRLLITKSTGGVTAHPVSMQPFTSPATILNCQPNKEPMEGITNQHLF
jgi:hypothetical protein